MPIDWRVLEDSAIKRMAWNCYDPDDLFTPIENLHEMLSSSSSKDIQFDGNYEISLALLMLADGLLPHQAYKPLAKKLLDAFQEITEKKYTVDALGIHPPPRGRKSNYERDRMIIYSVGRLKLEGIRIGEAYKHIAEEHHLSEDTIRRICERASKRKHKGRHKESS